MQEPESTENVLVKIESFNEENLLQLTDNGYTGNELAENYKEGIADGKFSLNKGGLAFYFGSKSEIDFGNGTKESYSQTFNAGDEYLLSIEYSDAKNITFGGNVHSTVTPQASGEGVKDLTEDELNAGMATCKIEIADDTVSFFINEDEPLVIDEITGDYRVGFTLWGDATINSLKIIKL